MHKDLNFDDEISFDTESLSGDMRTILVEGDLDGGTIELFSKGDVVRVPIDNGVFNDTVVDSAGKPVRRITVDGRQKSIVVKLSGSNNAAGVRVEVW